MKALVGFEPAQNENAANHSTYRAIQADIKLFSKLHLTAEYASLMF